MPLRNNQGGASFSNIITSAFVTTTTATPDVLVSDDAMRIFSWINFLLCKIIAVFGTGANILNIICFAKLDLKDAINVSFLGLAISDLGSEVTMLWISLCMIPAIRDADLPFDPVDVQSLVSGWPHAVFTRVTSWITALVTLERCLCITVPLKVKNIITPKFVLIAIACIFIIITAGFSPLYYASRLAWTFVPERNKTILKAVYSHDRFIFEQISHGITNIFIPVGAYVTVISSTATLVFKLRQKTKWRMKCTAIGSAAIMSERDKRVARMVVTISSLFIACFVPLCFMFVVMLLEPRISPGGQYENTLIVMGGIAFLLEGTNSALNIFIYYRMSSRYRAVFRQLFGLRELQ